jgi:hypothetical protein
MNLSPAAFEIGGLPLHPLVVHVVVVLAPLTALALTVGTVWSTARRRLGIVTPLAAGALVILVPVTVAAGDALKQVVGPLPAVQTHEGYGRQLLPWVIAMFVVAAVQWAWFRWGVREEADAARSRTGVVSAVLGVAAVLVAVGVIVMVVLIGESGARAVWGGVGG